HSWLMEGARTYVSIVIRKHDAGIKTVDGLRIGDAKRLQTRGSISSELSEIVIERTIFLQHEENVLDFPRDRRGHGYGSGLLNRVLRIDRRRCRIRRRSCGTHHL